MTLYNPHSAVSEEFISHTHIIEVLEYAKAHRADKPLIEDILAKATEGHGLTHTEAAVLMECNDRETIERIFTIARTIKQRIYGNRIVMFAPLYLSNHCINGCTYCPYHATNRTIPRRKLTQEQIAAEVIALQDMGHKRIAIEAGEHPTLAPLEYILESIETIYSVRHRNGAIRRANVNIAATTVDAYRRLHDAGIGTYILFEETYNREVYNRLHPSGPKSDWAYHTEAMDRAMQGGIDDVGIGALFGLTDYRYDLVGLLMHAEHLEAVYGVGPHTISVPRIRPADDIDLSKFPNAVTDDVFKRIVAILRIAVPYTGMIISTRESTESRKEVLDVGVSQISGGSKTTVGGYAEAQQSEGSEQFDISDHRTLDQIVGWLLELGYIPSFCTACYREGRTGDRFMSLAKAGTIGNCCAPNALMTLMEYLCDYASESTKKSAQGVISQELAKIPSDRVREITAQRIEQIINGERDFRF